MSAVIENMQLVMALADLETALESPMVPGELASWADNVRRQSALATKHLQHHIVSVHPAQCEEIAGEDPDMLQCVDHLRVLDHDLLRDFGTFDLIVFDLPEKALRAEPDEAPFIRLAQEVSDHGIALVIRARKQELAFATWLVEAFNRDTGEV